MIQGEWDFDELIPRYCERRTFTPRCASGKKHDGHIYADQSFFRLAFFHVATDVVQFSYIASYVNHYFDYTCFIHDLR